MNVIIYIILLICLLVYFIKKRQRDKHIHEQYLERQRQAELRKKYEWFANEHSIAIKKLREINEKYDFNAVSSFDMRQSYDSEFNFDSVSTLDYLTYQLVYIRKDVMQAIHDTAENKKIYVIYKKIVDNSCTLGQYDTEELLEDKEKLQEIERELFTSQIKKPRTDFFITVTLTNTNKYGYQYATKKDSFDSEEIEDIIVKLGYRNGDFYLDAKIWESICRVERAKVSNKIRKSIYERDGYRCRKCGSNYELEIDHIFPISKGGKSTYDNLQTLCHDCNSKKSNIIEAGVANPRTRQKQTKEICPNCGVNLIIKDGRYGDFYACPNYPKCKFTKQIK